MSFDIAISKALGNHQLDVAFQSQAKLIAVVGPSGIGKTSLLHCIAGLETPDTGHIVIGDTLLFDSGNAIDLRPEKRQCGYVFQDNRLFPHLSVEANLRYGLVRANTDGALVGLEEITELLDIAHLMQRLPAKLSGGEARRVAIGRALLSGPRFLLLDEPLASLDPDRAEHVLQAIERLRDELTVPILHVSHDAAEVTRLTDTIIHIG